MFAYGPGPLFMDARLGSTKSTAAAKEELSVGA